MVEVVRGLRVGVGIFTPFGTFANGDKLSAEQRQWLKGEGGYIIDRLAELPAEPPPRDEVKERADAEKLLGFAFVSGDQSSASLGVALKRHYEELTAQLKKAWHLRG